MGGLGESFVLRSGQNEVHKMLALRVQSKSVGFVLLVACPKNGRLENHPWVKCGYGWGTLAPNWPKNNARKLSQASIKENRD